MVCLDAGGGDYERMWLTESLRGVVQATVTVRVLETSASPALAERYRASSFRVMRRLLDRVRDSATGEVTVPEMNVPIPEDRRAEAEALAALEPGVAARRYRLADGMRAASDDDVELILNNTWRPTLSVIGAAGLPDPAVAGAVLRDLDVPAAELPDSADGRRRVARAALVKILTTEVPYGAQVEVGDFMLLNGWQAPATAPWLAATLEEIGDQVFDQPCRRLGIGGGIPFMEMLGRRYPDAQFVVTGARGRTEHARARRMAEHRRSPSR